MHLQPGGSSRLALPLHTGQRRVGDGMDSLSGTGASGFFRAEVRCSVLRTHGRPGWIVRRHQRRHSRGQKRFPPEQQGRGSVDDRARKTTVSVCIQSSAPPVPCRIVKAGLGTSTLSAGCSRNGLSFGAGAGSGKDVPAQPSIIRA